ncbi:MAG: type II secretion system protein [candidate division WOR-3 bacterium]|nr:type II secretion system protein [candidate division WOR-3 bacterium]
MKRKKGVSLIELIVSITIFAVAMTAIVMFSANNSRKEIRAERRAQKVMLQERTIEKFRSWLMQSPTPGLRFDDTWNNHSMGEVIYADTDSIRNITTAIEIEEFIPNAAIDPSDFGARIKLMVVSNDHTLNTSDTIRTIISRHK